MTIQLLKQLTEDELLQFFEERIAPHYARTTIRTARSILVNIAYRIPELVVLSKHLDDKELREEVVRAALDVGYSYATMRGVAFILVRLIRELAGESMDFADYYTLVDSFTSRYSGSYRKQLRGVLGALYSKIKWLKAKRDLPHKELREEVVKVLREIGYSENKARNFAGSVAIFIKEVWERGFG